MSTKSLSLIFILLLSNITISQNSDSQNNYSKLAVKAGYFGEFVLHPGFYGGVDYNLGGNKWLDLH